MAVRGAPSSRQPTPYPQPVIRPAEPSHGRAQFHNLQWLKPTPDWSLEPHVHSVNEIVYVLAGTYRTIMRGREHVGGPNKVFLYPRGEWHCPSYEFGKVEILVLTYSDESGSVREPVCAHDDRGRVQTVLDWMLELHAARDPRRQDVLSSLVDVLLCHIEQLGVEHIDLARRISEYVRTRLQEPLSLDELARVACLSKFHFVREFKSATGMPPMRYVQSQRLQAALHLIQNTNQPLKIIAAQVGICTEYHLSTLIRQYYGRTPSELRRLARLGGTEAGR